ncbi:hypothetical protein ACN28S_47870 [Cystobacter fuscus]
MTPAPSTSTTRRVHATPSGPMRREGSASWTRVSRSAVESARKGPVRVAASAAPASLSGSRKTSST